MALFTYLILGALAMIPYIAMTSSFITQQQRATESPRTEQSTTDFELEVYYKALASARSLLDSIDRRQSTDPAALAWESSRFLRGTSPAVAALATVVTPIAPVRRGKDLVIGLAKEIDAKYLVVFAASLREYAPQVDLALLIDTPSVDTSFRTLASEYRIELVEYHPQALDPPQIRNFHPSTFRWPLIARLLESHSTSQYRGVLFADVRDTAFQANPFTSILEGDSPVFYAFHGVESRTIGECGWNGGWIKDCFGEKKLQKLAKKSIICSGVSVATFAEARAYANQMSAIVSGPSLAHFLSFTFPTQSWWVACPRRRC